MSTAIIAGITGATAGIVAGAGGVCLRSRLRTDKPRTVTDTDEHFADLLPLDDAGREQIASQFVAHATALREQLSTYADTLAGDDPKLRQQLRHFEWVKP